MSVKLLTENHLEFQSLNGGCTGSTESTLVKIPHCLKSHVAAQSFRNQNPLNFFPSICFIYVMIKGPFQVIKAIMMEGLLSPLCTNGFFLLVCYNELGTVIVYIHRITGYNLHVVSLFEDCFCFSKQSRLMKCLNLWPHYLAFQLMRKLG